MSKSSVTTVPVFREDKVRIIEAAVKENETPMWIIREALRAYLKCAECDLILKNCKCGKG
jgi:predicted transcriptional regulator